MDKYINLPTMEFMKYISKLITCLDLIMNFTLHLPIIILFLIIKLDSLKYR